VVLFVISK